MNKNDVKQQIIDYVNKGNKKVNVWLPNRDSMVVLQICKELVDEEVLAPTISDIRGKIVFKVTKKFEEKYGVKL